jgi:hypothetical protein
MCFVNFLTDSQAGFKFVQHITNNLYVLSVDIKSWDIQNLLIVYQTFESSLKIKIVIKELNFNLMFLTICHNFYNLIVKSQIYPM